MSGKDKDEELELLRQFQEPGSFLGRHTPTKHKLRPSLRQNPALDTLEEAMISYVFRGADYDAMKAAFESFMAEPDRFQQTMMRMREVWLLFQQTATLANHLKSEKDKTLLAGIDLEVRARHPKANKAARAKIIENEKLLVNKRGSNLSWQSIVKKLPPSRGRR